MPTLKITVTSELAVAIDSFDSSEIEAVAKPGNERRWEVFRLRTQERLSYAAIGKRMGMSSVNARAMYLRVLREECPPEQVADARLEALAHLDVQERHAIKLMSEEHYLISFGRLAKDDDDHPIPDPTPTLRALDHLGRIEKRRSEIYGYDAPKRSAVTVLTPEIVQQAIAQRRAELGAMADRVPSVAEVPDAIEARSSE